MIFLRSSLGNVSRDPSSVRQIVTSDALSALALCVGVVIALVWSAGSWSSYHETVTASVHGVTVSSAVLNGLLTVFFVAVGLEMSREVANGTLRGAHAIAPTAAALGGVLGTVAFSLLCALIAGIPAMAHGWGVCMATDVAFVVGAFGLIGHRLPREIRLFVLALAVIDDIISLVVLGVSGVTHPHGIALVVALLVVCTAIALRRRTNILVTLVLLIVMWTAFAAAGIEPALAGVVTGTFAGSSPSFDRLESLSWRLTNVAILPLFALCACGMQWSHLRVTAPEIALFAAIVVTRILGKTIGIAGAIAVARRLGVEVPHSLRSWRTLGVGALCAVGFTVPLLFARSDFGGMSTTYSVVVLGLLVATLLGGAIGAGLLRLTTVVSQSDS